MIHFGGESCDNFIDQAPHTYPCFLVVFFFFLYIYMERAWGRGYRSKASLDRTLLISSYERWAELKRTYGAIRLLFKGKAHKVSHLNYVKNNNIHDFVSMIFMLFVVVIVLYPYLSTRQAHPSNNKLIWYGLTSYNNIFALVRATDKL